MISGRYINLSKLMWIKHVVSLVTECSKDNISSCIVCNFLLLIITLYWKFDLCIFILFICKLTTSYLLYCIIHGEVFNSWICQSCTESALKCNLRASIFKIFLGGMPPDPPSISMLCILIVLCTILTRKSHLATS